MILKMEDKRYIPHNSFLECDKGNTPTQLKVTHHKGAKIYGEYLASEADMIPSENISSFGICSLTGDVCGFEPIYWDRCNENAKVNGYKLVFEDACLLCKKGGKIKVSFDTPMSILQAMADELGSPNHWIIGLAIGNQRGMVLADKFRELSEKASKLKNNLTGNAAKETYGEILSKLDYQAKGYDINSKPHTRTFESGIDVSVKDPKGEKDILDETKLKSAEGKPYTNSRSYGKQGSTEWFMENVKKGGIVDDVDAQRVMDKLGNNSSTLKRVITKAEPNGNITRYELLPDGSTGNPITIGAANVVKGNTKAANFINNVGRTIQANKHIANANQWMMRNAHSISRVGKVVGRGAIVVGIVIDCYTIYSAYEEEGEVGKKTKEAIGGVAGGLAGGIAGAKIGAAIGALAGPVGIAVGGIVGGIIGGIAGSGSGKWLANQF